MGTTKLIPTDAQYTVHSEKKSGVQLVCKYLKAYETGGRRGIDRLFREGTIFGVIMFFLHEQCDGNCAPLNKLLSYSGSKKSKPVKFSAEPDLPSDVCKHLLEKFIPPSIRNTKKLQQLFLRYLPSKCEDVHIVL